ncbi:MAG: hypothetical protein L6R35_005681 [Caloplaca aegaea]|nr:MAG: hypothetical protein L6R35_005681 [Caloplaca aegaea]
MPVSDEITAERGPQNGQSSISEISRMLQSAQERLSLITPPMLQMQDVRSSDSSAIHPLPRLPRLQNSLSSKLYLTVKSGVAHLDLARSTIENDRRLANQPMPTVDSARAQIANVKDHVLNAGADWHNLPLTKLTPAIKRDLQLLKLRSTWDPKRHYKKDYQMPLIPEHSQIGTILEGPAEYYSSRISKQVRKRSFIQEILVIEDGTGRFKSKYDHIQSSKRCGRRAHYKQLRQERSTQSQR